MSYRLDGDPLLALPSLITSSYVFQSVLLPLFGDFFFPSLLPVCLTQFNFTCLVFHTCSLSTNCPPVSVNHPLQCTCLDSSFPLFFARWSCSHCQVVRHFQVWFLVSSFPSLCILLPWTPCCLSSICLMDFCLLPVPHVVRVLHCCIFFFLPIFWLIIWILGFY